MPSKTLTAHDWNILEKIKDPESAPSIPVLIDPDLPRDPHVTDASQYDHIITLEREIIRNIQILEGKIAALEADHQHARYQLMGEYDACINELNNLATAYPKYASAHNNYAQALRRKYGESLLLKTGSPSARLLSTESLEGKNITEAAQTITYHLDKAIILLSPPTPFTPVSPQAAKTLSQAYTQRAALYHITAKQMIVNNEAQLRLDYTWTADDLEEMASRDFMMGGRYGNEIAKALAVATNPTAKLCGSIVREAMKKEFGSLK